MYAVIVIVLVALALLCSEFMDGSIHLFSQYDPLSGKTAESAGTGSIYSQIASVLLAILISILIYLLVKGGLDQFSRSVGNIFHQRRKMPDESIEDYDVTFQKIRTKLNAWYTACRQWLSTRTKRQRKDGESGTGVNAVKSDTANNNYQKK